MWVLKPSCSIIISTVGPHLGLQFGPGAAECLWSWASSVAEDRTPPQWETEAGSGLVMLHRCRSAPPPAVHCSWFLLDSLDPLISWVLICLLLSSSDSVDDDFDRSTELFPMLWSPASELRVVHLTIPRCRIKHCVNHSLSFAKG